MAIDSNDAEVLKDCIRKFGTTEFPISANIGVKDVNGRLHELMIVGSPAVYAAASGNTAQLQVLLDAGCDVNGASLLTRSLIKTDESNWGLVPTPGPNASMHNLCSIALLYPCTPDISLTEWTVPGCTPLAAAAALGRTECVDLLLKQNGVWVEECSAVSASMLLPEAKCRFPGREECCSQIITELAKREAASEKLFPLLFSWDVLKLTPEALNAELDRYPYGKDFFRKAVETVLDLVHLKLVYDRICVSDQIETGMWQEILMVLERHSPETFDREEICSKLLDVFAHGSFYQDLYDLYLRHCGPQADVSVLLDFSMKYRKLETFLKKLSSDVPCVFGRDAFSPYVISRNFRNYSEFAVLLKYCDPLAAYADDGGLSGLTMCVLRSGDKKLFMQAQIKNVFVESKESMLRFMKEENLDSLRHLVLMMPDPENSKRHCTPTSYEGDISLRWYSPEDRQRNDEVRWEERKRLTDLLVKEHEQDYERELILNYDEKSLLFGSIGFVNASGERKVYGDFYEAISDNGKMAAVKAFFERFPGRLTERFCRRRIERSILSVEGNEILAGDSSDHVCLSSTPLCSAAAEGRAELVELLLSLGADPNEETLKRCSFAFSESSDEEYSYFVTPMLMAYLTDRSDIQEILRKGGTKEPDIDEFRLISKYIFGKKEGRK